MARDADDDKYFYESADAEITRRLCEAALCTRRLDAVSDGTAVSRSLPAQCGQSCNAQPEHLHLATPIPGVLRIHFLAELSGGAEH
jgi:hypothetical protein